LQSVSVSPFLFVGELVEYFSALFLSTQRIVGTLYAFHIL